MKPGHRSLLFVVLSAALALASCDKPEAPPPPPKVEAPKAAAPTINEELKRLAAEVYIYGYPLVLTDVTRQVQTAHEPTNEFQHKRGVPDSSTTEVANPNADFLYSQGWLDLAKEPMVLSVPDTKGRYYLIAMLDAWTNVATSIGKRTLGTDKGDFVIEGPKWKGTLPAGVSEVKSPTEMAWLFSRIQINGRADQGAAAKLQEQFKLMPLSQFLKRATKRAPPAPPTSVDTKTPPRDQVAKMDAATFFTRVAMLLPGNPPAKEDAPMVEKLKKLGIDAGAPFDVSKLEPIAAKSVEEGAKSALEAIVTAGKRSGGAEIRNGWSTDRDLGRWGVDYGKRAVSAWRGLGANAPEDALFLNVQFDGGGQRLDGNNRYVLHFDKGKAPPTDAFWSLSLYNDQQHFVANPLNRYNIGSVDPLKPNADGSLDIYVQNADPGKDAEANWLPAPKGSFNLILRIYWPKQEVLEGRWTPPGIKRAT